MYTIASFSFSLPDFPSCCLCFQISKYYDFRGCWKNQYGVPVEILLLRVAFLTTTNQAFNLARYITSTQKVNGSLVKAHGSNSLNFTSFCFFFLQAAFRQPKALAVSVSRMPNQGVFVWGKNTSKTVFFKVPTMMCNVSVFLCKYFAIVS